MENLWAMVLTAGRWRAFCKEENKCLGDLSSDGPAIVPPYATVTDESMAVYFGEMLWEVRYKNP